MGWRGGRSAQGRARQDPAAGAGVDHRRQRPLLAGDPVRVTDGEFIASRACNPDIPDLSAPWEAGPQRPRRLPLGRMVLVRYDLRECGNPRDDTPRRGLIGPAARHTVGALVRDQTVTFRSTFKV